MPNEAPQTEDWGRSPGASDPHLEPFWEDETVQDWGESAGTDAPSTEPDLVLPPFVTRSRWHA
jgi:hypothetical protein